tara:strand:- start:281 stop:454 length:174 start_codon:yes stop_codon:yes gene_type:complete
MNSEDDLLNLLIKSPNSAKIVAIAEYIEIDHNFSIAKIEMIYRVFGSFGDLVLVVLF